MSGKHAILPLWRKYCSSEGFNGQIKAIQAMAALLESYEHESHYMQSRQKSYNTYDNRNQNAIGTQINQIIIIKIEIKLIM